jgi:hypothetical protein
MGQDTHNITGVSAPVKFTYDNWSVIYKAMTAGYTYGAQVYILLLTEPDTGNDECYDVADDLCNYLDKFKPSNQAEFVTYANEITKELHRDNLLPRECTLLDQELHVFAEILDCHSRNLSRRNRPWLFNQEIGYTPSTYIDIIKKQTKKLKTFGIPKSAITINTYVWDD